MKRIQRVRSSSLFITRFDNPTPRSGKEEVTICRRDELKLELWRRVQSLLHNPIRVTPTLIFASSVQNVSMGDVAYYSITKRINDFHVLSLLEYLISPTLHPHRVHQKQHLGILQCDERAVQLTV